MRLNSVVLPAPFGPITLTISPSSTCRSSSSTHLRPPNAIDTPRSSSSAATSDDLHAALAEQPVRPQDHERDQERAEDDVPRRLGLRQHHVLPHEGGEVEHGRNQRQPRPAANEG